MCIVWIIIFRSILMRTKVLYFLFEFIFYITYKTFFEVVSTMI